MALAPWKWAARRSGGFRLKVCRKPGVVPEGTGSGSTLSTPGLRPGVYSAAASRLDGPGPVPGYPSVRRVCHPPFIWTSGELLIGGRTGSMAVEELSAPVLQMKPSSGASDEPHFSQRTRNGAPRSVLLARSKRATRLWPHQLPLILCALVNGNG
jgi:hypothetical protein